MVDAPPAPGARSSSPVPPLAPVALVEQQGDGRERFPGLSEPHAVGEQTADLLGIPRARAIDERATTIIDEALPRPGRHGGLMRLAGIERRPLHRLPRVAPR